MQKNEEISDIDIIGGHFERLKYFSAIFFAFLWEIKGNIGGKEDTLLSRCDKTKRVYFR